MYNQPNYCSECGQKILLQAKFCPNCGTQISVPSNVRNKTYSQPSYNRPSCQPSYSQPTNVSESAINWQRGFMLLGKWLAAVFLAFMLGLIKSKDKNIGSILLFSVVFTYLLGIGWLLYKFFMSKDTTKLLLTLLLPVIGPLISIFTLDEHAELTEGERQKQNEITAKAKWDKKPSEEKFNLYALAIFIGLIVSAVILIFATLLK